MELLPEFQPEHNKTDEMLCMWKENVYIYILIFIKKQFLT